MRSDSQRIGERGFFLRSARIVFLVALGFSVLSRPVFALEGEEHAASEAQGHAAEAHGTTPINWFDLFNKEAPPLGALFINFAILVFLLYLMLRNSLSARFKTRQETLETEIKEAREMKERAEKALAEARAKIKSIDVEMARLREEILGAGQAESSRIRTAAESQAERLRADAAAMVDQQIATMTQGIRGEIVEEIVALAEKIIRERITKADHERLVEEYVEEIAPRSSSMPAESWDGK